MGDQPMPRRSKRLQLKCSGTSSKRRKLSADEQKAETKITDVNDDCLMEIFEHLDLRSLLNIANSNGYLRPAARFVYDRKFGRKTVDIDLFSHYNGEILQRIAIFEKILVVDLKDCLQFLRCFGSSITSLDISCSKANEKRYRYVDQYINKYCAESLVRVGWSETKFLMEHFEKKYTKVEQMELSFCDLGNKFPLLPEWFPNLRHLNLYEAGVDHRFAVASFPHLIQLGITFRDQNSTVGFSRENVTDLLRMNLQLQDLNINVFGRAQTAWTLLKFAINNLPISKLHISTDYRPSPWGRPSRTNRENAAELILLPKASSSLVVIDLKCFLFSIDDVIAIIRKYNSLKRFCFGVENRTKYDNLKGQLDTEWKSSFRENRDKCFITLKREKRFTTKT